MSLPITIPPGGVASMFEESARTGRPVSLREHLGVDDPAKRVEACVREIRRERSKCASRAELVDVWHEELVGAFAVLSLVRLLDLASGAPR